MHARGKDLGGRARAGELNIIHMEIDTVTKLMDFSDKTKPAEGQPLKTTWRHIIQFYVELRKATTRASVIMTVSVVYVAFAWLAVQLCRCLLCLCLCKQFCAFGTIMFNPYTYAYVVRKTTT